MDIINPIPTQKHYAKVRGLPRQGGAGEVAPAGGRGESEENALLGVGVTPMTSSAERSAGANAQWGRGARGPGEGEGGIPHAPWGPAPEPA